MVPWIHSKTSKSGAFIQDLEITGIEIFGKQNGTFGMNMEHDGRGRL
jgi:hypothetical protein